jgi:iron complex transport system substrate-binding protein
MPDRIGTRTPALDRRHFLAGAAGMALFATARPTLAQESGTPAASGEWSFTDDTGQTVTLPTTPERIVAYLPLAAALWDFGVRPVAVYGTTTRPDGSPEVFVGEVDLDTVEALGETYGELDLERLVAIDPDLVVNDFWFTDIDVWGIPAEAIAQVESLAPIVHIKFVDRPVTTIVERVEELAGLLGADVEAADVVAAKEAFEAAEANLREAIAAKPGLTAIFIYAESGSLSVGNPALMADLAYLKDLGLDVVTPETTELWETLSWEEAGKHPADIIFTDARSFSLSPEELAEIPTFAALPAAQAGQIAPWQIEYIPSYQALTVVLNDLTAAIQGADPGIVG